MREGEVERRTSEDRQEGDMERSGTAEPRNTRALLTPPCPYIRPSGEGRPAGRPYEAALLASGRPAPDEHGARRVQRCAGYDVSGNMTAHPYARLRGQASVRLTREEASRS